MQSKCNQKAFSLLECMIYIAIFIIIAHLLVSFVSIIYNKHVSSNSKMQAVLNFYSAGDLLINDLRKALPDKKYWNVKNNSIMFYKSAYEIITWRVKNKNLIRESRMYDVKSRKWSKKVASVVAQTIDIHKVQLCTKGKHRIAHVMIEFVSPYMTQSLTLGATLRNTII